MKGNCREPLISYHFCHNDPYSHAIHYVLETGFFLKHKAKSWNFFNRSVFKGSFDTELLNTYMSSNARATLFCMLLFWKLSSHEILLNSHLVFRKSGEHSWWGWFLVGLGHYIPCYIPSHLCLWRVKQVIQKGDSSLKKVKLPTLNNLICLMYEVSSLKRLLNMSFVYI